MNTTTLNNESRSWLAKRAKSVTLLSAACGFLIGAGPTQAQPTTIATPPTVPAGQVISLYTSSSTYTNIAGVDFFEQWWTGQWTGYGDYNVVGTTNIVKAYENLLFTGVNFASNVQDISGCTNLHVDVFTPNGDHFAVRIVDTLGHSGDVVFANTNGVIVPNTWVSLDIPISQFVANVPGLNLHFIKQLGWIINGADVGVFPADYYVDNVYFNAGTNLVFTPPPAIPGPTNAAPTPTIPAGQVLSLYCSSGVYTNNENINWFAGWSSAGGSVYTITNIVPNRDVKKYAGLMYAGMEFYAPNQIDASAYNTLHVDVWTLDANQFGVKIVSLNPTVDPQVDILPASGVITTNKWIGLDIPLSQFTSLRNDLNLTNLQQMLWIDNQAGGGVQGGMFFIDNVYFYNAAIAPNSPTITASIGAGTLHVSFPTQTGYNYTVQYKTNLTDNVWLPLNVSPVVGNGATQTVNDTPNQSHRFYRVSVQ